MKTGVVLLTVANLLICAPKALSQGTGTDKFQDPTGRVFELLLPSEHLLGDWGGLLTKLETAGITPRLIFVTDIAGNPIGGRSQGVTAPSSIELSLFMDLEKMAGLRGGSIFISASERWGSNLAKTDIGNVFGPQQIWGFQTIRLIDFSYQQKLFDDRVELRLGRFAGMDDFLVSPYNFGLMSNAFCGNPFGILLDTQGMSAYYGTWAALVKVKPTDRSYVQAAIYNGDPDVRANRHHGVDFSMSGPAFAMAEAGYQVNGRPGDNALLGNYKVGVWYDDAVFTNFETGARSRGNWGFYGLFDQVIVPFGEPGSNRGVGVFGSVTVAPDPEIQQLPLFVTAGVSARGMFDARPRDALTVAVASGSFSSDLRRAQQNGHWPGPRSGQDSETVIELTYRIDLHRGAVFIQPDLQYIIQPGGNRHVADALVLGTQIGINF